jgi:hypothetical protein
MNNKNVYSKELKIKIGGKWLDCLIIGDKEDINSNFIAVKIIDIPKSSFKMFTKKL